MFERFGFSRYNIAGFADYEKSFLFINEKSVYTEWTSYLMENSFSEEVSTEATFRRINTFP
jgi:hypothetical protein